MEEPKENKGMNPTPASPKGEELKKRKVKVKIRQGRAITGVGEAGDVVEMDETKAQEYERDGYLTILKPFE